ncbi:F-box protein pof7 [Ceratocystis platani]|uniref:F-box protein pof7 n=1 Tax=Ceratocystis fimbriata f. sp. platani TaxID=88771 RepID=A0A0F8BIX8_CERFI|nr:F-box protein pof7 [Ceratocystis platani]
MSSSKSHSLQPLSPELEDFRSQWLHDLQANKDDSTSVAKQTSGSSATASTPLDTKQDNEEFDIDVAQNPSVVLEPAPIEDVESSSDEEDHAGPAFGASLFEYESQKKGKRELVSALDHFEEAIKKEAHGNLSDSLSLYRKAFRMDSAVDKTYRQKHFPSKPKTEGQKLASQIQKDSDETPTVPLSMDELLTSFSSLQIEPAPPMIEGTPPPPCPIASVPYEILYAILEHVAAHDIGDFARLAQVCKRMAFIVASEERIWRAACLSSRFGYSSMYYAFHRTVRGTLATELASSGAFAQQQHEAHVDARRLARTEKVCAALLPQKPYSGSWHRLFRWRPRLRFNGCYISRVNYLRDGQTGPDQKTVWTPVHVVTYFRYLRFLRDGTVLSLLTTEEPAVVVPVLASARGREEADVPGAHPLLAYLLRGRWRMADPLAKEPLRRFSDGGDEEASPFEVDGDIVVETEGIVPKYTYLMQLALRSSGKVAVNNKINWTGFWSYNGDTERWSEFPLKNEKPFIFSRVKAFGFGELQ